MKAIIKAHLESAKKLLELMSIAGWLALLADVIWVVRDSVLAGFPLSLIPVMVMLVTGFVMMTYGLWKYHKRQVQRLLHKKLLVKSRLCKLRFKHREV